MYKNPYAGNPYALAMKKGSSKDEEDELLRSIQNYQTRLAVSGQAVPEPKGEDRSALGKAFMGTLNFIDRPANAVRGAIQYGFDKNPNTTAGQGMLEGVTKRTEFTGDAMWDKMGIDSKLGRFGAELGYQVATDPLSYMTFGVGGLVKGLATGRKATMSADAAEAARKAMEANRINKAKQELFNKYSSTPKSHQMEMSGRDMVVQNFHGKGLREVTDEMRKTFDDTIRGVAYKGSEDAYRKMLSDVEEEVRREFLQSGRKFGSNFDDAVAKRVQDALDIEAKNFGDASTAAFQNRLTRKAGPGVRVFGKEIVPGTRMQDLGAEIGERLSKGTTTKAGKQARLPIDEVRDSVGRMFSSYNYKGIDKATEDALRLMRAAKKGQVNYGNMKLLNKVRAFERVLTGLTDNEGRPLINTLTSAMEGSQVKDIMHDTWVANPAYMRTPWEMKVGGTKEKNKALAALGLGSDATVADIAKVMRKDLMEAGTGEQAMNRLNVLLGASDTGVQEVDDIAGYMSRQMTEKARGDVMRQYGPSSLNTRLPYAASRQKKWEGLSVEQINKEYIDKYGNGPLFEENILKVYSSRMLAHNRVMAASESITEALAAVGEKITFTKGSDELIMEIQDKIANGYEILIPNNFFTKGDDVINDIIESGFTPLHKATNREVFTRIKYGNKQTIEVVDPLDAVEMKRVKADMPVHFYVVPQGFTKAYNGVSTRQTIAGLEGLRNIAEKFYEVWKPLVTSLNMKFHTRNFMSAAFNNFLDVGRAMFDPDTQKTAAAVAMLNMGQVGRNASDTISKEAKQYYDEMLRTNAVSAFGSSDANAFRSGAENEIGRAVVGKVHPFRKVEQVGRAVGNRTEEYVRAVNFITHRKMGFTPEMAADMTRRVHFDYTDLSEFEQTLKLVFPFYTWLRNNIPYQMENFLNDPRLYQTLYRAATESARVNGIEFTDLPTYMQETMGMTFGRDEENNARVFDAGLPMSDLFTGASDVAGMLSPLIKGPIELYTNQNMVTGAPLYKYDEQAAVNITNRPTLLGTAVQTANKLTNGKVENALIANPNLSKFIDYSGRQMGALGNLNRYGASTTDSADSKTVKAQYDLYNGDIPKVLRSLMGMVDPRTGHVRYVNVDKLDENTKWQYYYELGNYIQMLKDQGYEVPTITELKKQGLV